MMKPNDLAVQLLNELLDRYERSKSFSEEAPQHRRVLLRLYQDGKSDFPLYDIEDSTARQTINQAAAVLATEKLIEMEWMRGEEGHILRRIALVPSAISDAYLFAGRTPMRDKLEQLQKELSACREQLGDGWAKDYIQSQLDFIQRNHRSPAELPADLRQRGEWLTVLRAAAMPREEPLLRRVFSARHLGDSKAFETLYQGMLVSVLRRFLAGDTSEMSEEELLYQVGIEQNPEQFSLCGDITLFFHTQAAFSIDPFADGIQLSARDAAALQVCFADSVRTLLFIENRANYYDYLRKRPEHVAAIYHGGFLSPQRSMFFKKLCEAAGPDRQLLHWGDIDLGGFQMHAMLRREIDPRFMRYRMDKEELLAYTAQTSSFSEDYAKKITLLLQDPVLDDAQETITYMLSHRVRLEQEALL